MLPRARYLAFEGEENVGRLDVPMHDPLLVHVLDCLADLRNRKKGNRASAWVSAQGREGEREGEREGGREGGRDAGAEGKF